MQSTKFWMLWETALPKLLNAAPGFRRQVAICDNSTPFCPLIKHFIIARDITSSDNAADSLIKPFPGP